MTPVDFQEANAKFGPPAGYDESQVGTVRAWIGTIQQGSCDGTPIVVVAWKPSELELKDLNEGKPVYVSMFEGLVGHCVGTSFHSVTHTA